MITIFHLHSTQAIDCHSSPDPSSSLFFPAYISIFPAPGSQEGSRILSKLIKVSLPILPVCVKYQQISIKGTKKTKNIFNLLKIFRNVRVLENTRIKNDFACFVRKFPLLLLNFKAPNCIKKDLI